jgi:hypothetical protein
MLHRIAGARSIKNIAYYLCWPRKAGVPAAFWSANPRNFDLPEATK